MIRINLLPTKEAERALGRRNQRSIAVLGVLLALLFMIVPYVTQGRRLSSLDRQIEETQHQIERYNEQVKEVERLDQLRSELETKLQIIEELNEKRVGPARMLSDLSVSAPTNMWLTEFREATSVATLSGLALDNETIAEFMRRLQSSPYFYAVDLVEANVSTDQRLSGFKRFIIQASIDYFGQGGRVAGNGAGSEREKGGSGKEAAKK